MICLSVLGLLLAVVMLACAMDTPTAVLWDEPDA